MKNKILIGLILMTFNSNAMSETNCEIIRDVPNIRYMNGFDELSDFWADEVTGIDLVEIEREAMRESLTPGEVFVCDSSEDNHTNLVRGIVDRELKIHPSTAVCHQDSGEGFHDNEVFAKSLLEEERHSSITNLSMAFNLNGFSEHTRHLNRSILIQGSGNDWALGSPLLDLTTNSFENVHDDPQILVGAMGPDGISTEYSQEGEKVSILAPVGNQQYTTCSTTPCRSLSGTSFAAPQVTYMFKVIRELLPEISKDNLVKIMNNSAIATYHSVFEKPRTNGVGLLNGFKMWRTSLRIKDRCKSSADISSCIDNQLDNSDIYRFDISEELSAIFNQEFPSCGVSRFEGLSCEEKKTAFINLRESFLLNPTNGSSKMALQCAYSFLGYKSNGLLYGNLSPTVKDVDLRFNSQNPKALRFKNLAQQEGYVATMSYSASHNKAVLTQLSLMGMEGLELLLKHGDRSTLNIQNLGNDERRLGEHLSSVIRNESDTSIQRALDLMIDDPLVVQQYFMFFKGFSNKLDLNQKSQIGQILALGQEPESRRVGYDMIYWSLRLEFDQEVFNFYKNGLNDEDRWTRINVEDGVAKLREG